MKKWENSALFSSRSHLTSLSALPSGPQRTFCPLHHSNRGDTLPVTKVSSAESWHRRVGPCCGLRQHRDCCKRVRLWDVGLARRLFLRVSKRIWYNALQIFELLGKSQKTPVI